MAMASSSALLQGAAAAAAARAYPSSRKVFVTFNGLKASPMVHKQLTIVRCAADKPVTITCSSESETLKQIQKIVASQLAIKEEAVTPEKAFSELGADSLDTVEIVMALEEHFKISVEQEGAEKIVTVQDAANLIDQLVTANK